MLCTVDVLTLRDGYISAHNSIYRGGGDDDAYSSADQAAQRCHDPGHLRNTPRYGSRRFA